MLPCVVSINVAEAGNHYFLMVSLKMSVLPYKGFYFSLIDMDEKQLHGRNPQTTSHFYIFSEANIQREQKGTDKP